jgi:hypothetical protein
MFRSRLKVTKSILRMSFTVYLVMYFRSSAAKYPTPLSMIQIPYCPAVFPVQSTEYDFHREPTHEMTRLIRTHRLLSTACQPP